MTEVKVALIGNQNNNFFTLLRYLRDFNIDAELLLLNTEDDFFSFESDTFFPDKYRPYVKKLPWGDLDSWQKLKDEEIEATVSGYTFLIGCGSSPAFMTRIGIKLDIFIPYGADIYVLPFFQLVHPKKQLSYLRLSKSQRQGIESANTILCDKASPEFEEIFNSFRLKGTRLFISPPFIYLPEYNSLARKNVHDLPNYALIASLKEQGYTILFQYCRQMWKSQAREKTNIFSILIDKIKGNSLQAQMVAWNLKGNDRLIKGFGEFVLNQPENNFKLVLVEYGIDVAESKFLIKQLGLENFVIWLPKMPRKEIMACIDESDVIVGELAYSYLTYGVVYEALSLKKPIMHYRNDSLYETEYGTLYPMLNARFPIDVLNNLEMIRTNATALRGIGEDGYNWLMNFIDNNLKTILRLIKEKHT